jgi:pyruvate/2-oxoglutarate dehydrogenase complex dihydrolipoamide acyltransferase (E2) component
MVFESNAGGVLVEVVAVEGETVPLGGLIARRDDPGAGGATRRPNASPVARDGQQARRQPLDSAS